MIDVGNKKIELLTWSIKVFSVTINYIHHISLLKADTNPSTSLISILLLMITMSYWTEHILDCNHKKSMIDVNEEENKILSCKILKPLVFTINYIQPISSLKAHTNTTTSSSSILLLTITMLRLKKLMDLVSW